MNRQSKQWTKLVSGGVVALAGLVASCLAVAANEGTVPVQPCGVHPSGQCVAFGANDVLGSYQMATKPNISGRVKNYGVLKDAVWDTTAPVALTLIPEPASKCEQSVNFIDLAHSPMNLTGSHLFINRDHGQYMYLVYANQSLERQLTPVTGTVDNGSSAVLWLQAQQQNGDPNPYDYFVEFDSSGKGLKRYRIEAFPHLDSNSSTRTLCDCERPDVINPGNSGNHRQCTVAHRGVPSIPEPSTGEGNEPGHN